MKKKYEEMSWLDKNYFGICLLTLILIIGFYAVASSNASPYEEYWRCEEWESWIERDGMIWNCLDFPDNISETSIGVDCLWFVNDTSNTLHVKRLIDNEEGKIDNYTECTKWSKWRKLKE